MTNMVENGSSERLMTQRKAAKPSPIVIVNNQVFTNNYKFLFLGNEIIKDDFLKHIT